MLKDKIKVALKQKYSDTGLGDDVMDGVAEILSHNVKEEAEIVTRIPTAAILKIRLTSILVSPFYHSKIRRKAAAQKLSTRHSLHSFPSFVIRFSYSCES